MFSYEESIPNQHKRKFIVTADTFRPMILKLYMKSKR